MHPCPRCDGSGFITAFVNRGPDIGKHSVETLPCSTCSGVGSIDDETARRIADGKSMRDQRVARLETLRDAARRLGMTSSELSAIEQGRKPAR